MREEILKLLGERAGQLRVLVVGDVMVDRYVVGEVERISPEAPVPVLRQTGQYDRPGGAANVAMNLAGLGLRPTLLGFVGEDEPGASLRSELLAAGIAVDGLLTSTAPTTLKTRIVSRTQQLVRFDREGDARAIPAPARREIDERCAAAVPHADAVILSDYGKGALSEELCQRVIELSRRQGVPVLVDPKGRDFSRYAGATTICPNGTELALATGVSPGETMALFAAGRALLRDLGLRFLTVTLSEKGIQAVGHEARDDQHAPAQAREVFDVSGAGDTVIAALAAGLAGGLRLHAALHLANVAAGLVVAKAGTVPVTAREVMAQLSAASRSGSDAKIVERGEAIQEVQRWRKSGETVVFTNGCFDLLHVGHVSLLERCRQFGSKLVVGVNTDASVATLKGPGRPIVGEAERCRILAALASVDMVVAFAEPTSLELIRELRPSVLVKGGEYTTDRVVGHADVLLYGGRVELVPMVEGFSTTEMARRLRAAGDPSRKT